MLDNILLQIAKTSILEHFDAKKYSIDKDALLAKYPYLKEKGASFVTLNKKHDLRGCIGSIIAHRSLLEDIISNAKAAAFNDPRFSPLKEDEFACLTLEVSVLTEPKEIHYSDIDDLMSKITPHKDGLILVYGSNQGTFLPQVWEQIPTVNDFLVHLSYKAGLTPDVYKHHPHIYSYQVEAIEEKFDAILPLEK